MKHKVEFISLEDSDKDIIVSFAIDDFEMGVKSLILHRTLFFEYLLEEAERGVKVSLEGDYFDDEDFNILHEITIADHQIDIKSSFRSYELDVSGIEEREIRDMVRLLNKQNYDNRFQIHLV
jgi:hypothetical protein